MLTHLRRVAFKAICMLTIFVSASPAQAQHYPSNVIRIVAPTGPGSPPDILSRIIATELATSEGWRVVVDNRPGALQTIGVADVLKQPADGHSILAVTVPTLAAQTLLPKLGLRLEVDLSPVIKFATGYNVLVVHPSVPAKSVAELIAVLKNQPDKFNFASGGFGTPAHLIGEMFKFENRRSRHPCPVSDRATANCRSSQRRDPILIFGSESVRRTCRVRRTSGTCCHRAKAGGCAQWRADNCQNGLPGTGGRGLDWLCGKEWDFSEIVAWLNEAMNTALNRPGVREALARSGYQPAGGTPAEFGSLIKSQLAHWGTIIADFGHQDDAMKIGNALGIPPLSKCALDR